MSASFTTSLRVAFRPVFFLSAILAASSGGPGCWREEKKTCRQLLAWDQRYGRLCISTAHEPTLYFVPQVDVFFDFAGRPPPPPPPPPSASASSASSFSSSFSSSPLCRVQRDLSMTAYFAPPLQPDSPKMTSLLFLEERCCCSSSGMPRGHQSRISIVTSSNRGSARRMWSQTAVT